MGERMDTGLLVLGFRRAADRFRNADGIPEELVYGSAWRFWRRYGFHPTDPGPTYDAISTAILHSLFEALNWAVAVDDRIKRDWPDALGPGREWQTRVAGGSSVRALRYARNCVHHDWAIAVELPNGSQDASGLYLPALLTWTSSLEAARPDPKGKDAYGEWLAGSNVATTLLAIDNAFEGAGRIFRKFGLIRGTPRLAVAKA